MSVVDSNNCREDAITADLRGIYIALSKRRDFGGPGSQRVKRDEEPFSSLSREERATLLGQQCCPC
jgi:hypothetical protein